jgi:hypothetical protein
MVSQKAVLVYNLCISLGILSTCATDGSSELSFSSVIDSGVGSISIIVGSCINCDLYTRCNSF